MRRQVILSALESQVCDQMSPDGVGHMLLRWIHSLGAMRDLWRSRQKNYADNY